MKQSVSDSRYALLRYLDYTPSSYLSMCGRMIDGFNEGAKRAARQKALRQAGLSIINESQHIAGENIGGSTAAPDAPEAASDDDDGDGDGDPDPERRRSAPRTRPQHRITRSTASLPPAQLSRPKAACALLGIGRTKLWQLSERDPRFPRKIVLGPRCVGWRTDALLDYLRLCEQEG